MLSYIYITQETMRLTNQLIEEVVAEVAGQDVVELVMLLKNRNNFSEFKLADALKKEINTTRNMLYKLYKYNLVSFTRRKDRKKGWYIYYWSFNNKRIKELFSSLKKSKLRKFKERLDRENQTFFFICPNGCMRLDFDQATDFEFKCPECGNIMQQQDNEKTISNIKEQIKRLEKEAK